MYLLTMKTTLLDYPTLNGAYTVPDEKLRYCQKHGHVTLRDICTPEDIEPYRLVIEEEVNRAKNTERGGVYAKDIKERDTRNKAFLQFTNMWRRNAIIEGFSLAQRFGHIAAQLLGTDAVRIYHDQALFKEPGAGYTPWHQDQYYWPMETGKTVTMWMPLTPMGAEMGTLIFADGSHRDGPLGELAISDHSEAYYRSVVDAQGMNLSISELDVGDATWHYGWTLHKAPGNTTPNMRQVMTIIYCADDCEVLEPQNTNQAADLAAWLPGQQAGETVGSPMNPIVWDRNSIAG
jgi:ectoine hydroxylase-related dioxygenase (phytanoyl-CoA dioxygenase family)